MGELVSFSTARRERDDRAAKQGAKRLFTVDAVELADGSLDYVVDIESAGIGIKDPEVEALRTLSAAVILEELAMKIRSGAEIVARGENGATLCSVVVGVQGVDLHISELGGRLSSSGAVVASHLRQLAANIERVGLK